MERNRLPVAVFDSGLGGISVLRAAARLLPEENFLYYGDSLHAPYGVRSSREVTDLCRQALALLLERGIKALVLACNTATSAAGETLRREHPELPIIGIEPALKPAVLAHPGGRVLVMATEMTLNEGKFHALRRQFSRDADIQPVPCSGLMEFVERGILDGPELDAYLTQKLEPFLTRKVDAVVLGCTHYPFLLAAIRKAVGPEPQILDGSDGVAGQLRRRLEQAGLRNPGPELGCVEFANSLEDPVILQRSRNLFEKP